MSQAPRFVYDIASPYLYLAASRVCDRILEADWTPISLAGLFKLNGRTSWRRGSNASECRAEIEARTATYNLPPITWPTAWTFPWIAVMRAAVVAKRRGRVVEFSMAAFRAAHAEGTDLGEIEQVLRLAPHLGLAPDELGRAIQVEDVEVELRAATEAAHASAIPGVPAVQIGDQVFWGDDRLEEAAAAMTS